MNIGKYLKEIQKEELRNKDFLHLTANESQMSETARIFLSSKLSERYYAGIGKDNIVDFDFLTMLGFKGIYNLVTAAEDAAKEMLGAKVINLNCLSGIHAMMCTIFATTNPGDTVMTLQSDYDGHFATKGILERIGRKNIYAVFNTKQNQLDIEATAKKFIKEGAIAIYLDPMYYISPYDIRSLRKALGEKAIIIYDASHTIGLIMGQEFQSPLKEGADIICANTHKTLPGPHKGMIAFKNKTFGEKANIIINSSLSSCHTQHLLALAVTILELKEFGREYARQIINNSNSLGEAFSKLNYRVAKSNTGRYSENHQLHVYVDIKGERLDLNKKLVKNNISTNFIKQKDGKIYIRLGTQEVTRRGMKEKEMKQITSFIDRAFKGENIKEEITSFNRKFKNILYSFDQVSSN